MIDQSEFIDAGLGEIIADRLLAFVEEIRGVDLVDLVSFIRFESFPTVEDLVNSSTELYFKPETLMFSWAAGVDLKWDAPPVVTIGLEFRHGGVVVFFNLTLDEGDHRVDVLGASFDAPGDAHGALVAALASAMLPAGGTAVGALAAGRQAGKARRWP